MQSRSDDWVGPLKTRQRPTDVRLSCVGTENENHKNDNKRNACTGLRLGGEDLNPYLQRCVVPRKITHDVRAKLLLISFAENLTIQLLGAE